jgi:hypothetical protein
MTAGPADLLPGSGSNQIDGTTISVSALSLSACSPMQSLESIAKSDGTPVTFESSVLTPAASLKNSPSWHTFSETRIVCRKRLLEAFETDWSENLLQLRH